MKMMEEWVVTFGFSKENPKNAITPLAQQFHGQLNKDNECNNYKQYWLLISATNHLQT